MSPVLLLAMILCGGVCIARAAPLEADYIVVGAGSAGSVAAGRLAAAGFDVLVLEAGAPSQAQLGGCSVKGNCPWQQGDGRNLTVFDVPMEWLTILQDPNYSKLYGVYDPSDTSGPLCRCSETCCVPEWEIVTNRTGCLPSQVCAPRSA